MAAEADKASGSGGLIKGPQAFIGGVALMALAAFALWLVSDLSQGTLRAMGPAMLPRWLAIGVGMCGLGLAIAGLISHGHELEPMSFRGPVMVVLGILCFAVAIRGELLGMRVPQLGLIGAGPLAMFIGGFASNEVRWRDLLILALALTSACMILFGDLLNLPIPLYPQWMSDLYPQSFSNDARMRTTAALLIVLAVVVYFVVPAHKEPEEVDVVTDQHPGTLQ